MAEAAVEGPGRQRFYCHQCNIRFAEVSANFTCPQCSNGFIEEVQAQCPGTTSTDDDMEEWEDDELPFHNMEPGTRFTLLDDNALSRLRRASGNRTGRRTTTRYATLPPGARPPNAHFEDVIQDFILNLGVGLNWSPGVQMVLGNPADYAWGRGGLDAIVTQLLNQMDTTGPPPLTKDVIDALPIVRVTNDQVKIKLQCSVCWDDFNLDEAVRQLPCQHIYHEPCIRPWLELHGTCPICRQNLIQTSGTAEGHSIPPTTATSSLVTDLIDAQIDVMDMSSTSSANTSTSTSSSNMSHQRGSRSRSSSM